MKAETIQADDFPPVLVTGYKHPYTESRIASTPEQVEAYTHELERLGCKKVRVLQNKKPHAGVFA
jgi:hypothetical protein